MYPQIIPIHPLVWLQAITLGHALAALDETGNPWLAAVVTDLNLQLLWYVNEVFEGLDNRKV